MKFIEIGGVVLSWVFWILVGVLAIAGALLVVMVVAIAAREARRRARGREDSEDEWPGV